MQAPRICALGIAFIVTSASALPAHADQLPNVGLQTAPLAKFLVEPGKDPYATLFKDRDRAQAPSQGVPKAAQQNEPQPLKQPTVVCGTTLIPADGSIDPKIRKSSPKNNEVTYAIRAIKPPMCHPQ